MKLLINTATTHKGGSIQVARSFLEECKSYPEHEFHVILGLSLAKMIDLRQFPDNFYFYPIDFRPATRVFSIKSRTGFFRELEKMICPDVVFTTSGPAYWRPTAPHLVGYNLAHHIYPDSSFMQSLPFTQKLKWRCKREVIRYFFKKDADAYVVQTDAVNLRVRRFLNTDKVYTIPNTCSAHYFAPAAFPERLPPRMPGEFRLLTLSAWYQHKNLTIIPKVVDALPEEIRRRIRFIVTLSENDYSSNFGDTHKKNIINVGPVPVEQGPSIYKECDAMFLPTLLECFSASYPEAMAMKKTILTSDLDFATSICQDAALYFNPMDPAVIADQICNLVGSEKLRAELIEKGVVRLLSFGTAQSRASRYIEICREISGNK